MSNDAKLNHNSRPADEGWSDNEKSNSSWDGDLEDSHSSSSSSLDGSSQASSSSSSSSEFDRKDRNNSEFERYIPTGSSEMRNRRRFLNHKHSNDVEINSSQSPQRTYHSRRIRLAASNRRNPQTIMSLYKTAFGIIISKKSSTLLLISILMWLYVQFHVAYHVQTAHQFSPGRDASYVDHKKEMQQIRDKNRQSAFHALGSAAGNLFQRKNKTRNKPSKDGYAPAADRLPKDCSLSKWQMENFPSCNEVHDLDLREVLNMQRRGRQIPADLGDTDRSEQKHSKEDKDEALRMGYVGSGLWRQVWKVEPRLNQESAVVKIMKGEHDVNPRNFDRHRRDALVMERLTKSPHVVSIYGFCGNTVMTEFAGTTLDDYVYENGSITSKYDVNRPTGKLELALDVMRGLEALHENDIVHADIQTKQFLIDPADGVKVNDFNRCRFMPRHDKSGDICKVKIPSAPGAKRSPEEYEQMRIDSKIDVFSAGNILFGILTGAKPFGDMMRKDIRGNVMKGIKPNIDKKSLETEADRALANIIDRTFEFNPDHRPSAAQLVNEIEQLIKRFS